MSYLFCTLSETQIGVHLGFKSNFLASIPIDRPNVFNMYFFLIVVLDSIFLSFIIGLLQAMISVQKKLQERVPGFHFNLGFSGGYFLHGNEEEDEGDWELVKNADKFWWFSHMWLHQKAHTRNTLEEMVEDLKKNLEFAKVRDRLNAQTFY